ncbi:hypothetical protein LCGC14_1162890, partial [marine sediment metagenome]
DEFNGYVGETDLSSFHGSVIVSGHIDRVKFKEINIGGYFQSTNDTRIECKGNFSVDCIIKVSHLNCDGDISSKWSIQCAGYINCKGDIICNPESDFDGFIRVANAISCKNIITTGTVEAESIDCDENINCKQLCFDDYLNVGKKLNVTGGINAGLHQYAFENFPLIPIKAGKILCDFIMGTFSYESYKNKSELSGMCDVKTLSCQVTINSSEKVLLEKGELSVILPAGFRINGRNELVVAQIIENEESDDTR